MVASGLSPLGWVGSLCPIQEIVRPEDHLEPYFRLIVRGGRWTFQHRDVIADCIQVVPRPEVAKSGWPWPGLVGTQRTRCVGREGEPRRRVHDCPT